MPPVTSAFLCPYSLDILFSKLLNPCSYVSVRVQVSRPYKTTGNVIVLTLTFLNSKREDKEFWTKWHQIFPESNRLIISSGSKLLFVSPTPRNLNFPIFSKDILAIFVLWREKYRVEQNRRKSKEKTDIREEGNRERKTIKENKEKYIERIKENKKKEGKKEKIKKWPVEIGNSFYQSNSLRFWKRKYKASYQKCGQNGDRILVSKHLYWSPNFIT